LHLFLDDPSISVPVVNADVSTMVNSSSDTGNCNDNIIYGVKTQTGFTNSQGGKAFPLKRRATGDGVHQIWIADSSDHRGVYAEFDIKV
jgi:hypothetical protein